MVNSYDKLKFWSSENLKINFLGSKRVDCPVMMSDGKESDMRIEEIEEGFGFPQNYTLAYDGDDKSLSKVRRLKLLGKALDGSTMLRKLYYLKFWFASKK